MVSAERRDVIKLLVNAEVPKLAGLIAYRRHVLALSAKSAAALQALAGRFASHLAGAGQGPLPDICYTANTGRAQFPYRLAVPSRSVDELREALDLFGRGEPARGSSRPGVNGMSSNGVVFLRDRIPVHRDGEAAVRVAALVPRHAGRCDGLRPARSVTPVGHLSIRGPPDSETAAYTQPALFAVEYALAGCGSGG